MTIVFINDSKFEDYLLILKDNINQINIKQGEWAKLVLREIKPKINEVYVDKFSEIIELLDKVEQDIKSNMEKVKDAEKAEKKINFWRKYFSRKKPTETSTDTVDKISFYVFNSNEIDKLVSSMYGAYAQEKLIGALYKLIRPLGGWNYLPEKGILCSHGDLFEQDIYNKPTGITIIGKWIQNGLINIEKLDSGFVESLKLNPSAIDFVPYAIGVCPIDETMAFNIHSSINSDVIGYLGYFTVEPNPSLSYISEKLSSAHEVGISGNIAIFSAIALALSLLANRFGIRSTGEYWGWQLSEMEMSKMGLTLIKEN